MTNYLNDAFTLDPNDRNLNLISSIVVNLADHSCSDQGVRNTTYWIQEERFLRGRWATMESLISAIAFGTSVVIGYTGCKQRVPLLLRCDRCDDRSSDKTTRHTSSLSRASSFYLVRHLSSNSKWSEYSDGEESFIQDFPKVELHVVRA